MCKLEIIIEEKNLRSNKEEVKNPLQEHLMKIQSR